MADTKDGAPAPTSDLLMPLFSLKGRTAIVSGAGSGIGLAIAHALAEAGANVAIWYNNNTQALERAAEIEEKYGVRCKAYQVAVTTWEAVQAAVDEIVGEFGGRLDVFVANSGIAWEEGPFIDGSIEAMQNVLKVNVEGTLYCARAAALHWRRQRAEGTVLGGGGGGGGQKKLENYSSGSFICTASMSGHIVNVPQMQMAYNASKAAVIHACKSFAVEWVGFARANSVSPGYIKTDVSPSIAPETKKLFKDKIPMGREGEPGELRGAYLYLASDASSYTTGIDILVDGGYCLP